MIARLITYHNETNLPVPVISCEFQVSNQSNIKFDILDDLTIVEKVQPFLQNMINKKYAIIKNSNSINRSNQHKHRPSINSFLSFCSVFIITYDMAICLSRNKQHLMQNVVVSEESSMKCIQPLGHHSTSHIDKFSAEIAAYLAYVNLPLHIAIYYSHRYSIHFPFLHSSTMTFTEELWSSVDSIYSRMLRLPFLNQMLDSTLHETIYNYYIVQDYHFFIDREYMLGGLVEHCTNDEEVRQFFNILLEKNKRYVQTILTDHNLSSCDGKTIQKTPACMKYTKLVRKLGRCCGNFSWIQGLIALLPCTLVYAKIGDWMIASGVCPTIKRYADCIDTHRDQGRRDRLVGFLQLTDRVVNNCSHVQRQKLKKLFQKVCEYEYAFWNDAYHYGTQKIPEKINTSV